MNVITSIDGVSLMADIATLPDCLEARRTAQWALGLAQKARDDLDIHIGMTLQSVVRKLIVASHAAW